MKRDLSAIMENLGISETDPKENTVLVLVISLLTASLRSLKVFSLVKYYSGEGFYSLINDHKKLVSKM